jgi:hypothetical protein
MMANNRHVELIRQGVETWNRLKQDHPLTQMNLKGINLKGCDLRHADFNKVDLSHADLQGADLRGAQLVGTNLRAANLKKAKFADSDTDWMNMTAAVMEGTLLFALDLSNVEGLESVFHYGPSSISTDTLALSKGAIPRTFLRGCGFADWEIEVAKLYTPNLPEGKVTDILYTVSRLRGSQPLSWKSLFLSYSHKDSEFVGRLERLLDGKGIRYWRDVHDLRAGRLETQVDLAIRHNPTVLVVLSRHSCNSDWVEWEVSRGRDLERTLGRDVLCPIALDETWRTCRWSSRLRQQMEKYYILDFSSWCDSDQLKLQFDRLLDGLALFYESN